MTTNADAGIDMVELTEEQERAMLERSARQLLGLSADEFARRWAAFVESGVLGWVGVGDLSATRADLGVAVCDPCRVTWTTPTSTN